MSMSSLFNMFGNQKQPNTNNGFINMINRFNNFKDSYKGNPEQEVRNLINSGQMSQSEFNRLSNAATQFQNMMNGRF